ncbi:uncharacterized protein LOC129412171 [Boleophthalmus pectinirostris]|uniref:uncharacterized protein LOC129412171 n=1 Tax=Boleophthalmus pectinirostris TaxID=150288 RepID=UPI00242EB9B4|nr:uncharacterized protein LOC129412171 [Boleophthalmus pectinirostris]
MMKTSVKLLTLVALFICVHSAAGLQCRSCGGSSCSSQTSQICSSGQSQCVSRTYAGSYNYGYYNYTYNYTYKGCASASDCTAAGSEFVSYNYGPNTYAVNTTCCDTDNCNNQNQPIVAPPVGSLQCYSCDPSSYECTANVTCNTQEVCAQAVVDQYNSSRPFYGCVSENLCNNPSLSRRYFGFSTSVSCCNTSHCNVPDLGLQCSTCTDSSCSSQRLVTCSKLAPFCYTDAYAGSYDYGSYNYSGIRKGCASSSVCTAAGSEFDSYDHGSRSYLRNKTCCDTDDCNTPNPTLPPVGSLQCYSCDPYSYECTANVTCNTQEVCGQAVVDQYNPSRPFYGCFSENWCNNTNLSRRYFGFSTSVSCCNTSHCNVPDLGLQCLTCTDSSCSSQRSVTCSKLAPFCYTDAYAGSYDYGSSSYITIRKGCASSSVCTAAGSEFDSYDYGYSSYIRNTTCCDTDDCNAPNPTFRRLQCMSGSGYYQYSVTCPFQTTACFSRSYTGSYDYGDYINTYSYTYKGCASASDCTAAGSEFVSYNYGPNTYAVNTTCCDTDNCNNQNQSIVAPPVGSLQCYSCDPSSYECTANVTCNTQEVCGQAVEQQQRQEQSWRQNLHCS